MFHLLIHFALYFSKSELWLRLIGALIPGLVTIFFLMLTLHSQWRKNKLISLVAGLFLASNSWHIFYSQELRPYALPAMWATISWYLLLTYQPINHHSQTKSAKGKLVLFMLVTILGLYTSYLYPLLILSQLAYFIYLWLTTTTAKNKISQVIGAILLASLTFLAWLPRFKQQLMVSHQLRQALPTWQTVVSIPQAKGLFLVFAKFVFGVLRVAVTPSWIVVSFWLVGLSFFLFWSRWSTKIWRRQLTPFLFWLIIPVVSAWLISFFIPVLRPKRVLLVLPALEAFWAFLVIGPSKNNNWLLVKLASLSLLLSLIFINIYSDVSYFSQPLLQREPWRQAVAEVTTSYARNTIAVFAYPNVYSPWRWYAPPKYPVLTTGQLNINQVDNLKKRLQPIKNYQQVIIFDYLTDLTDNHHRLNQEIRQLGFEESKIFQYPNIGFIRIYAHRH